MIAFMVMVLSIMIMHFLMPKEVLKQFFKPPYFREFECLFFSGIPYAPIRTVMFMRVIANPKSGRARRITDAYKLVPNWYRVLSKVILLFIYAFAIAIIIQLIGFGVLLYLRE
jgi:hypothetical protein